MQENEISNTKKDTRISILFSFLLLFIIVSFDASAENKETYIRFGFLNLAHDSFLCSYSCEEIQFNYEKTKKDDTKYDGTFICKQKNPHDLTTYYFNLIEGKSNEISIGYPKHEKGAEVSLNEGVLRIKFVKNDCFEEYKLRRDSRDRFGETWFKSIFE